jgi:ABC-type multidrug transport system fused ATPase/permease subunit
MAMPLGLRQLLRALERHPNASIVSEGLPYIVLVSLAALVGALAQNRTTFLSTQSGIILRASLTAAIYQHALQLSPAGRDGLTAGEITNLVAVDTQKIYDVMVEGHNAWSCPLLILLVSALLWVIMGPELVIGVLLLIAFLPIVQFFVTRMMTLRKERSKLTDVRINILTAMLQGIRVTKLNHYETKVEEQVRHVRRQEMKLLRKELRMWGWVLTSAVCSPLLATTAAFSFYALAHYSTHIVTPADAFTALLFFSILRFPINMAARLVGKSAQAIEGLRRIEAFLQREVRPTSQGGKEGASVPADPSLVVNVENGSFGIRPKDIGVSGHVSISSGWERSDAESGLESTKAPDEPIFNVHNLSLSLKKSEVIAIVGKVGSGKTTLLRAMLGEVPANPGTDLVVADELSYAPQIPFILNRSLRDNILFGSDYDQVRYERILDACCLRDDVRRLGPAGDLSQIGERGVTLSGGQKQRVALARACYAKADLALLDDCFSALDSSTAGKVFEGLFRPASDSNDDDGGVLRPCGTLLVTHAQHFLPKVDKILVMVDGEPSFFGTYDDLHQFASEDGSAAALINSSKKEENENQKDGGSKAKLRRDGAVDKDGIIMTVEEREYGVSSFKDWATWFINAGGISFVFFQIVFLILDRGLYIASDWWLAKWSDAAFVELELWGFRLPPQSDGRSAQVKYVEIYCIIVFLSCVATASRTQWMCKFLKAGMYRARKDQACSLCFLLQSEEVPAAPKSCLMGWPSEFYVHHFRTLRQPPWDVS